MDEREAFEMWADGPSGIDFDHYVDLSPEQIAWEAWQARAALAERAEERLRSYVIALAGAHKLIAELEAAAQPQADAAGRMFASGIDLLFALDHALSHGQQQEALRLATAQYAAQRGKPEPSIAPDSEGGKP